MFNNICLILIDPTSINYKSQTYEGLIYILLKLIWFTINKNFNVVIGKLVFISRITIKNSNIYVKISQLLISVATSFVSMKKKKRLILIQTFVDIYKYIKNTY